MQLGEWIGSVLDNLTAEGSNVPVYADRRPQEQAAPFLIFSHVSATNRSTLQDFEESREAIIQFDLYATTSKQAHDGQKEMQALFSNPTTRLNGYLVLPFFERSNSDFIEDVGEGGTPLNRISTDFKFIFQGE